MRADIPYVELLRDRVAIPLSRGMTAIVDGADADLAHLRWTAVPKGHAWYALRHGPRPRSQAIYLHRVIAERAGIPVDGRIIDHVDRDGLHCWRSNLRCVTNAQNGRNSRRKINNASGYKGVWWHAGAGKWAAQIRCDGQRISLGVFASKEAAAEAYAEAALRLHGEFAYSGDA